MCAPAPPPTARVEGHFQATGVRPRFLSELVARGIKIPGAYFDPSKPLVVAMPFELDTPTLIIICAAISVVLFAEAVYLLGFSTASYRSNVNRRLKLSNEPAGPRGDPDPVAARARADQ